MEKLMHVKGKNEEKMKNIKGKERSKVRKGERTKR